MAPERLQIEVAYAERDRQTVVVLEVPAGTTLAEAVALAAPQLRGVLPADAAALGIHGRVATPGTVLVEGDRVELYRPLSADPKEARRRRARAARRSR